MFDASPAPQIRALAFYLPQYHPVPENDAFWGAGFTEWRNVVQARPRFTGHAQPHLPADLGFYDLRVPEVRAAQADLARAAGLSGFCYYHYWFSGQRLLNHPFDAVLASGAPDFPFMLCWANENWTRAWDGGESEILLAQRYSDTDTAAHARHLAHAFADPRYIRIGNRPVFAVYNTDALPCPRRWSDAFRDAAQKDGSDPYLIRVERYLDRDIRPPGALGFDAALEFQPFSRNFHRWQESRPDLKRHKGRRIWNRMRRDWQRAQPWRRFDRHHDMEAFVAFDVCQPSPEYTLFPGVCPAWDNSARRPGGRAIIFRNSSPALFGDWLRAKTAAYRPAGDANLLFINAWNEWAEGNYLEPCLSHGHGWLEAVRTGLTPTGGCAESTFT
ncbi:MAG: glycoside hydrolase family 99-like domain-containing protein [Paracoccaceae bacterium]|nr:glycoside hydrolase family 99-like domain-containing protein [Paracoccaceae bacterium]